MEGETFPELVDRALEDPDADGVRNHVFVITERCFANEPLVVGGGWQCGCAACLGRVGLTLVYDPKDEQTGVPSHMWRRRIVSVRTANAAELTVLPGYRTG